ncbi:MAG: GLPGLI family protein [Prevotella sp.]
MRFLFISLFLLFLSSVDAVAQEQVRYRVVYDFSQAVIEGRPTMQTRWAIDVGDTTVASYNYNSRQFNKEIDSLRKVVTDDNLFFEKRNELVMKYPGSGAQIVIGLPASGKYTLTGIDGGSVNGEFLYEEALPAIEWEDNDSTKTIEGYLCHKATGRLYGRTWTAWYADDIPLPYGPYLLGGLPGLILEATDSEGLFRFTLAGLSSVADGSKVELVGVGKYLKCTREQYIKQRNKFDSMSSAERIKLAEERLSAASGKKQKIVSLNKGKETTHVKTPKRVHIEKE